MSLEIKRFEGNEHLAMGVMCAIGALCPVVGRQPLTLVHSRMIACIIARKFAVVTDSKIPVAYIAWGDLNDLVAARLRQGLLELTPDDLVSGKKTWIVSYCAPVLPEHGAFLRTWASKELKAPYIVESGRVTQWQA